MSGWIVVENMPGYLPDSDDDPYVYETREQAIEAACEDAERLIEHLIDYPDAPFLSCSLEEAQAALREDGVVWVHYPDEPHNLGRVIEVFPVLEEPTRD